MRLFKIAYRLLFVVLIFIAVLAVGKTSIEKLAKDIELKDPVKVLSEKAGVVPPILDNNYEIPDTLKTEHQSLIDLSNIKSNDQVLPNSTTSTDSSHALPNASVNTDQSHKLNNNNTTTSTQVLPNNNNNTTKKSYLIKLKNGSTIDIRNFKWSDFAQYKNKDITTNTQSSATEQSKDNEAEHKDDTVQKLTVTRDDLNKLISSIRVSSGKTLQKYDRESFEKPVQRYELNGRKVSRKEYAIRTSPYLKKDDFEYICPYTGTIIYDKSKLDFDHIIALGYVFKYGDISNWSDDTKHKYAYAQDIGVCVLNKSNRSKSDKGPADWLPDTNIEDYCYTWLVIAAEWDIAMRQEDIDVCKLQCINAITSHHNLNRID